MSSVPVEKRPRDVVDDDAEREYPPVKARRPDEEHPSHPHYILDHLVRHVLPERCRNDKVTAYYKAQLDDPDATIAECKSFLADWVLKMWTKGTLWRHDLYATKTHAWPLVELLHIEIMFNCVFSLKLRAVKDFPRHGAVYVSFLAVEGEEFRYAGQTNDADARIIGNHESPSYRNSQRKFLYFLRERAEEVFYLLPIDNAGLRAGPIHNILEQWVALIFRSLQPSELKHNLCAETLRWIPADEMHKGVNVREPLAQGFGFQDYPMTGTSFKYSPISLKREWYEVHRNQKIVVRKECFLRGDIFPGSFWHASGWYGKADYEFQIWSVKLRVGKAWIDRCAIETIRMWCDLRPEGEIHPDTIARGSGAHPAYNDPAYRLGIKVSGIRNGDKEEGWCWLMMDGDADKAIPQLNRLVDWLDGLDTEELRPRRWYPANKAIGRPRCGYTRHPRDAGEKWKELTQD